MTKTFECSHGGVVCRAKIEGETEEEVLAKAVEQRRRCTASTSPRRRHWLVTRRA